MKNSGIEWIGQIPDSWQYFRLKDYYVFEKGKNAALYTQEYIGTHNGEFPVYSGQTENDGIMGTISSFDYDEKECLFTTTVGAKVMTPKVLSGKFSLSQNCLIMKQVKPCCNKYIFYQLLPLFDYTKSMIPSYMQPSLRVADLNTYGFFVPNKAIQEQIADCLDCKCAKIDKLIEVQQAQIEKLKEYKQSVITEAVTKGLDPTAPMKDSGVEWIGKISVESRIEKLKFLLSCPMQYGANESGSKEVGDGIRYVRITDITEENALKNSEDNMYLPQSLAENYILRDKDVLFARSGGTVGKTFIYEEKYGKCAFAGYLIKAECDKKKLLARFLSYYTQSSIYELWKNSIFIQATIQNIGATKYSNMEMVVHSIEEQKNIVSYLDDKCAKIDKLIALKQSKIEKLQEYKKSLIYEYVTGKKEVM